ncbi:NAD-P-binding protein [Roridomyces roridus]|uniref:NAD-P-binding protein n=1 Tax=Roridomyces roridus TaxID=1738132 RepID=A0AAD7FFR2_9AGAR|nr:NAD-P-binding protein [Roridomyces roridus]
MPSLATAESTNATFSPSYIPIAIFVGGTSGVGQAMAEAFARQTNGRAHIILIGRSAASAAKIIAGFPQHNGEDGCLHEFVACDAESIKSVRAVCAGLRARLGRFNFLVVSAAGPAANSFTQAVETSEGLNAHLSMRYFMRYSFIKELVPLLDAARQERQHAHFMSVCGAGLGVPIATDDLGLHEARESSWTFLRGLTPSVAAIKGMIRGATYNDALVAYFAAQHPNIAFTHIHPGQVLTAGGSTVGSLGLLFVPLRWVVDRVKSYMSVSQDECAQYMLYALLDTEAQRGMFIRNDHGDLVGSYVFDADDDVPGWVFNENTPTPTSYKAGVLNGIPVKGYGGSDATVSRLVKYTEEVLSAIQ